MASALMACSLSAVSANAAIIKSMPMKGDLNGDKVINETDLKIMTNNLANGFHIANLVIYHAADVNWDGRVDRKDYLAILDDINGNEAIKSGNVEGNNYVTSDDVQAILDHINGKYALDKYEKVRADINSDGKINITDVSMLQNYLTK